MLAARPVRISWPYDHDTIPQRSISRQFLGVSWLTDASRYDVCCRFVERRRTDVAKEVAAARAAYRRGQVKRGTVDDLMAELAE
jgi:hypothetical protein